MTQHSPPDDSIVILPAADGRGWTWCCACGDEGDPNVPLSREAASEAFRTHLREKAGCWLI